jgi:hypothetical protein
MSPHKNKKHKGGGNPKDEVYNTQSHVAFAVYKSSEYAGSALTSTATSTGIQTNGATAVASLRRLYDLPTTDQDIFDELVEGDIFPYFTLAWRTGHFNAESAAQAMVRSDVGEFYQLLSFSVLLAV